MARLLRILMNLDTQYLQVLVQRQMYLCKRRLQVIGIAIALFVGAIILMRTGTVDRRDADDFDRAEIVITEDQAIAIAFQEVRELGLADPPTAW
jgi:hypothetical protein